MINKLLISSLMTIAIIFSACDGDSEGESRLETQVMLDNANYEGVISKLAKSANVSDEENLALGAAYMGRAGLSLSDLVKVVGDSGDEDNAFGAFISSIEKATKESKTPLADLQNATASYDNVVGNKCNDNNISDSQKDLCIFKGLSQVMSTATTFSYIADDIGLVFDNNGTDAKLTASTCAMEYALTQNNSNAECTINILNENIIFTSSGLSYKEIEVTTNQESFEYLLTSTSTVITKGYCSLDDFAPREDNKTISTYHVCPVNEDANATELTTGAILADALNNGVDSISGAANDDDMKDDINEFKKEVLASSGKSSNETITEQDIVNYLNEQNN